MITTMMIRRPVSFFVVVIIIKLFIFPGEFFYMKIFLSGKKNMKVAWPKIIYGWLRRN